MDVAEHAERPRDLALQRAMIVCDSQPATGFGEDSDPSRSLSIVRARTLSSDFFHVDTITFRRIYALFFIDLERRQVFLAGVTAHPIGSWVTQQARNLTMTLEHEGGVVKFLIRDRDTKFVGSLR